MKHEAESAEITAEAYLETAKTGEDPLLPGLTELADVLSAISDPDTVFDSSDKLPVAHDIGHNSWYGGRASFFGQDGIREYAIGEKGLFYYAGHAAMAASLGTNEQELIGNALSTVGEECPDILFEYSSGIGFRDDVVKTAGSLGLRAMWLLGGRQALYASTTGYQAMGGAAVSNFVSSVYEASATLSAVKQQVDVVPTIDLGEFPDLYDEYVEAFTAVSAAHPSGSTLNREDFEAVLGSDGFIKFVAYDNRGISGLCVLANVQDINWFDQNCLQRLLGSAYDQGRGLACPLIYRRKEAGIMQSLRIFSAMGTVFEAIDTYPEFVVETNEHSIKNIPRLFELGSKAAGVPSTGWNVLQRQAVDVLRVQRL